MPALNPQAAATLCISFCKYQLSSHTLHDDYQMPVSTSWLEKRVKNLCAMELDWDWTESRSNDWHRPPGSEPIPYRLWRRRTCSCCRQRHCRSRCRGNCCTVDTFNSCEQVCSSKKEVGGRLKQHVDKDFLNNLGLHTHTHARTHARTHTHTHTHTQHTRLTAIFPGLPRWAGTRKEKPIWILLKQETVSGSGICWATCKFAPRSRQITTPVPHHSVFYRPDALPAAQTTASKHWRPHTYTHTHTRKKNCHRGSLVLSCDTATHVWVSAADWY